MRRVTTTLGLSILLGLFSAPAWAGWTYIPFEWGDPAHGFRPAGASFNWARACKRYIDTIYGAAARVEFAVERKPGSNDSWIQVEVIRDNAFAYREINRSWYAAWSTVWINMSLLYNDQVIFKLGDSSSGPHGWWIGSRYFSGAHYSHRYSVSQIADC